MSRMSFPDHEVWVADDAMALSAALLVLGAARTGSSTSVHRRVSHRARPGLAPGLDLAKRSWAGPSSSGPFRAITGARRFYERHGFVACRDRPMATTKSRA